MAELVLQFFHARGVRWGILLLVGFVSVGGQAGPAAAEAMSPGKIKAPLKYALRLPKFCGNDYFGRTGPQDMRPPRQLCGVRTNHFCGGLVSLMMARDEPNPVKKRNHYGRAEKRFLYTQRGIAEFPQCPLHRDVEAALMQLRIEMRTIR